MASSTSSRVPVVIMSRLRGWGFEANHFCLPLYHTRNGFLPSAFRKSLPRKGLRQNCHFGNGDILPILPFSGCITLIHIDVSRCHVTSSGFQLSFRINGFRCVIRCVAKCTTIYGIAKCYISGLGDQPGDWRPIPPKLSIPPTDCIPPIPPILPRVVIRSNSPSSPIVPKSRGVQTQ